MQHSKAGRSTILVSVVVAALAVGFFFAPRFIPASVADDTPDEERLINIDVKDGEISAVLRMLAKAANVDIVIGENVVGRVEAMTLRDVTVDTALRMLTLTKGYHWHKEGNIYVVTSGDVPGLPPGGGSQGTTVLQPLGSSQQGTAVSGAGTAGGDTAPTPPAYTGPPIATTPPSMVNPGGGSQIVFAPEGNQPKLVTAMIPLKFTDAEQLAYAFGGGVMGSRMPNAQYKYQRPSHVGRSIGRSDGGGISGPDVFGGSQRGQWGQDDTLGGRGGSRGGGTRGGSTTDTGGGTTGGRSSTRGSGSGGGSTLLLPGEMEPPTAFLDQNALIVKGTQDEIDQFTEIINMLDVKTREVEISTKFVNVQTTGTDALGIDWTVSNGALEFWNLGFAPATATNNVVRYSRGRFQATLAALMTNGRATVVNEPRVTCPNNQFAEVNFYTTIPYFVATSEYNQFGQRVATEVDIEEAYVENSLYVMPRINADDTVTLYLEPMLEDQIGEVVGPNGEAVPIITTQYVSTTVTVPDGDTVVMGGLIRKDESTNYNHTPLLSKLPIIGPLFRSKTFRQSNSELLIFVTPQIIRDIPPQ